MRKISMLMIATVFLLLSSIHAQTTLNPGDLVIVTANADGTDNFDFIPLVDIQAGTVIKFTDNAWTLADTLRTNEGTVTWTASADVTKGTVVSFTGATAGDWVKGTGFDIAGAGDNILVYQGTATTPSFIYGIGWGKANNWTWTGNNDSNIPLALSVASKTIVQLGTMDDYQYNGPTSGTAAQLLAMVAYAPYWVGNDVTAYTAYPTAFTITATATCTAPYALTATGMTASSANLGWSTFGTEVLWNVEYGVTGFVQGAGTTVSGVTNPYTLNGLTQNTTYQYYVQADCGGSTSVWTGPFSFTTPYSCPKPTLTTVANITATSADLGWTNGGTETAWIVYYKTDVATDYTEVTGVTTNPYTLGGLTANTNYIFKVKANCSVSDTSFVSVTKTFSTIQVPASIPYTEGFETWPNNWTVVNGTQVNKWAVGTVVANTGTQSAYVSNDNGTTNAYTLTSTSTVHMYRDITFPAGVNPFNLKLNWKGQGEGTTTKYDYLRVFLVPITTTPVSGTELTGQLGTYNLQPTWQTVNLTLANATYANQTWRLVVSWKNDVSGGTQPPIAIDDIAITELSCAPPTVLTATSITANGANLGWTAGGTETLWNVEYGVTGFVQGTGTTVTGVTNPYTVGGLTQNTTYQFYVKADCGGSGTSSWAGPFSFTTPYSCPKPTLPTATNVTTTSADLGWTNGGTETAWIVYYKTAAATDYTEVTGVTTNPYTLGGLTSNTNYIFKVKANCSVSDTSYVSVTKTFTTPCAAVSTYPSTESFGATLGCWSASEAVAGASYHWASATADATHGVAAPKAGTNFMALNVFNASASNNPYYLTSPSYVLDATAKRVSYYYWLGSSGYTLSPIPLTLQISTDGGSNWSDLYAHTSGNSTLSSTSSITGWTQNTVSLAAYTGQTVKFRFASNSNYGSGFCNQGLDEFVVEDIPSCIAPTTLTATSITASGATLGWTAGGSETLWNVEYGVTGFVQGAGTTVTGVTNPYTVGGLTQNTTYQFYVKADCGGSGTSTWAGPFSFTTPYSCPKPTLPTVANITTTSADLAWTNGGTETAWIVYYKTAAATDYTEVTGVTTNPYTLNGLSAGTSYIFKVKANCSVSDTSFTSATQTFATTCNIVSTFPYIQNFNAVTLPALPICFSQNDVNADNDKWITYDTYGVAGSKCAGLYTDYNAGANNDLLILPQMTLTGNERLKFSVRSRTTGEPNDYTVVLSTTDNNPASFTTTLKPLTAVNSAVMTEISPISLSAYTGNVWIAIQVPTGGLDGYYLYVDDIIVETIPSCFNPTALNATSITASGATLGWTAGGTETTWNVEYGVTGFVQGAGTTVTGVANPYTLTGLTQNTTYQFYVQSDCGGSGTSTWSGPISFTTAYSCPKPTLPTVSNITAVSADLAWTAGGTETSWIVYYKTAAATSFTEVLNVTTNPYTLSGLSSGTNYIFKVKANCSVSDTSVMSNTQTFATTCAAITALPYVEPFATYLPSVCWLEGDAGDLTAGPTTISATAAAWGADGFLNNGSTGAARINVYGTTHNDWLISPEITIPAGSHRLKYSVGATQYADVIAPTTPWESDDVVQVLVSTTHPANWTVLKTYDNTNVPSYLGQDDMIDLAAYAGQTIRIAYRTLMGSTNSSSDIDFFVDNFTVEAVPSCEAPLSLTANAVTSNSADIAFTSAAPNFNVRYRIVGASTWSMTTATASPASITGLNHSSQYEVQIMAFCSATDSSAWSSVLNFSTLCGVYQVPFLQDFNVAPNCWTLSSDTLNSSIDLSGTSSSWGLDNYLNISGGQAAARLNIYGSSLNSWLLSPEINLGTGANQLEFDLAATVYNGLTDASGTREDDKFAVVISTDGGTTWAQANVLRQWDNTGSTYVYNNINATPQHITIDLSAYTGVVKLAFYGESFVSGNGDNDLFVDNVAVNPIPVPCATPTALAATNVAQTTADLGWTSTAANFNVRYRTVGATSWTDATASTTTLALISLTANTQYEFQVQAVCSATAGDTSAWATAVNFTTLATPACATPTALAATNIAQTTADLGWTSTAANFNVRYRTVGATVWTAATATTTTLALTALTANTQYEFQVQAVCSATAGDTSAWATAVTFTTLDITPTCDAPTALVVSAINSAGASLSWTNGGTETAWNIRYKKVVDATYTNVNNTTTKPYVLTGLQANTAYVWNVQAICSGTLNSAWSADNTFTTTVGVEDNSLNGLSVYSYNKEVNVINNGNILVKAVVIYDMLGQEVGTYAINSTDNVLINSNLTIGNYVVKVITETKVGNYKLFIK